MVVDMKTMAIEFTLTRETWIRDFALPSLREALLRQAGRA